MSKESNQPAEASAEDLQQQVDDLRRQLLQAEKLYSLGSLSSGIAHHFNNLLSVILGYASHVANREDCPAEAEESLRHIAEAAQKGRRLTEEILAFAGDDLEEAVVCNVHETVQSVFSLLQSQAPSAVRMDLDLQALRDEVRALNSEIHQIVFNLLSNAIDCMPEGGQLTVSSEETNVETDQGSRPHLRLIVTDTAGAVLNEELGSATGTGLKLNSVYGMVKRLEGTVTVNSDPGKRTRVEVILPLMLPPDETVEMKPAKRKLAASRIWVVDDDPLFRQMCRQVLADEGHDVREIDDGTQLLQLWEEETTHPDLLVIDFSMPEYNGLELTEKLRSMGTQAPIVLVSGFAANQPDIRKALAQRKTFFLQKPFSLPELSDTVTVALGETLIGE